MSAIDGGWIRISFIGAKQGIWLRFSLFSLLRETDSHCKYRWKKTYGIRFNVNWWKSSVKGAKRHQMSWEREEDGGGVTDWWEMEGWRNDGEAGVRWREAARRGAGEAGHLGAVSSLVKKRLDRPLTVRSNECTAERFAAQQTPACTLLCSFLLPLPFPSPTFLYTCTWHNSVCPPTLLATF